MNPFALPFRLSPEAFRSEGSGVDFAGTGVIDLIETEDGTFEAAEGDSEAFGIAPVIVAGLISLVPMLFDGIGKAVKVSQGKKLQRMKSGQRGGRRRKRGRTITAVPDGFTSAAQGFFQAYQADPERARAAFRAAAQHNPKLIGDEMSVVLGSDGRWYDIDSDGVPNAFDPMPFVPMPSLPGGADIPGFRVQVGPQPQRRAKVQGPHKLPRGLVRALARLRGKPAQKAQAIAHIRKLGYDIGDDFGDDFGFGAEYDFGADFDFGEEAAETEAMGTVLEADDIAADLEIGSDDIGAEGVKSVDWSERIAKLEGAIRRADGAIANLTRLVNAVGPHTAGMVRSALAKLVAARGKAKRKTVGAAITVAAGEPKTALLNKLPMLASGASTPRNVFTIPAGGTATAVALLNEDQPYLDLQVVGLVAQSATTSGNSEGMVEDYKLTGGPNLFIHEGATHANDYNTPLDELASLRHKPDFKSPSRLSLSVYAVGNQNEIVVVSAKAVCKVLSDSTFGRRNARSSI